MNPADFTPSSPGRLVTTTFHEYRGGPLKPPTSIETVAFLPNPLPPDLDWNEIRDRHFDSHSETLLALGRVNGLHTRVGNAAGLLRTLWMREAKLSSEVENIYTTAEDLVLAGAGRGDDVRDSSVESWNYVRALEYGISSPLLWLAHVIREMHQLLLNSVRGKEHHPGRFRSGGVYFRSRSPGVEHARFIPMPPQEVPMAIDNLQAFVNAKHPHIPPLFAIALTHYQFEAIHPFADGNGRIGRVLNSRSLVKERLLDHPVVYMSAYVNEHRQEYADHLLRISQEGGDTWSDWIGFILDAIRTQALDAIWRSEELINLQERFRALLKEDNALPRLYDVVDWLFTMPALNVTDLMAKTRTTRTTAGNDMDRLERLGILRERTGRERDHDWTAPTIAAIISHDSSTI